MIALQVLKEVLQLFNRLESQITHLRGEIKLMATKQELDEKLAQLGSTIEAEVGELAAAFQVLKDKVAQLENAAEFSSEIAVIDSAIAKVAALSDLGTEPASPTPTE